MKLAGRVAVVMLMMLGRLVGIWREMSLWRMVMIMTTSSGCRGWHVLRENPVNRSERPMPLAIYRRGTGAPIADEEEESWGRTREEVDTSTNTR